MWQLCFKTKLTFPKVFFLRNFFLRFWRNFYFYVFDETFFLRFWRNFFFFGQFFFCCFGQICFIWRNFIWRTSFGELHSGNFIRWNVIWRNFIGVDWIGSTLATPVVLIFSNGWTHSHKHTLAQLYYTSPHALWMYVFFFYKISCILKITQLDYN